jgi:hypothetical protein
MCFNIGLAGNILFIRTNTEINADDFHNALAKLSSPNLAIIERHSIRSPCGTREMAEIIT